jgi:uncharacterized membrane protein (UPF0127 family)
VLITVSKDQFTGMKRHIVIYNRSRSQTVAIQAVYCASFMCQLRGLTFRKQLAADEGLLLVQAHQNRWEAAIHMLAMWIDLTVIWIDSDWRVVDVQLAQRGRLAYVPRKPARYVLETAVEHISEFTIGDQLQFEDS